MYYGPSEQPPEEQKSGCRDVWLLTRAAFGLLVIPFGILIGGLVVVAILIALFSKGPLLGLAGVLLVAASFYAYARWERHHFRGP